MKIKVLNTTAKQFIVYVVLFLVSSATVIAKDFRWKGGYGKWSDPAMWEEVSGSNKTILQIPSKDDNVLIDRLDASINIDVDAEVADIVWENGTITGDTDKNISIYGDFSVSSNIVDQFSGVWQLKTAAKSTINVSAQLSGSVTIEADGEVSINTPLHVNGNFTLASGSLFASNTTLNVKHFVLTANGRQNIQYNDVQIYLSKPVFEKNPLRTVTNSGVKFISNNPPSRAITNFQYTVSNPCETDSIVVMEGSFDTNITTEYQAIEWSVYDTEDFSSTYGYESINKRGHVEFNIQINTSNFVESYIYMMVPENGIEGHNLDFYLNRKSEITLTDTIINAGANVGEGSITVNANSNGAGLLYTITPGGDSNNTGVFTNLAPGTYEITVIHYDDLTWTSTCDPLVISGIVVPAPQANTEPLGFDRFEYVDITCDVPNNVIIQLFAKGGDSTNYQYRMDTPTPTNWQSSNEFSIDLPAAAKPTFLIRDGISPDIPITLQLSEPLPLTVTAPLEYSIACYEPEGEIEVTAGGGVAPYLYSIDGTNYQESPIFSGLLPDSYTVRVKDYNNCEASCNVDIVSVNFTAEEVSILDKEDIITCYDDSTGRILLKATITNGGTARFSIDGGNFTGGEPQGAWIYHKEYTGLKRGVHTVHVKDFRDTEGQCTKAFDFEILAPDELIIDNNILIVHEHGCNPNTGSINVTAHGGTGALQYSINGANNQSDGNFTNLAAGSYNIIVTDENGCSKDTTLIITRPEALVIDSSTSTNITCHDLNNGTITLTATGGITPHIYSITGNPNTQENGEFIGLAAGTYIVTVTDSQTPPCTNTASFTIINPDEITIIDSLTTHNDVSCFGENNGELQFFATGGTGTLTYTLVGGNEGSNTTGRFVDLEKGTYAVSVTDSNNCTPVMSSTVVIDGPDADFILISATPESVLCFGANTGSITVNVSGGTSPYTYSLNNGTTFTTNDTTYKFENLAAGTYNVTVDDANNCDPHTQNNITVNQPVSEYTLVNTSQVNVNCKGVATGEITVTVEGGTAPYTYSLNEVEVTAIENTSYTFTGLAAGNYTVSVTDSPNCLPAATASVTITEPAEVFELVSINPTNILCYGEGAGEIEVVVKGGTAPYNYAIVGQNHDTMTTNYTFTSLAAGIYTVTVTDAKGCTLPQNPTVEITQPADALTLGSVTSTEIKCSGGTDGTITINVSGGTMPYTYHLTNGAISYSTSVTHNSYSHTFEDLGAGTYTYWVVDNNNCETEHLTVNVAAGTPMGWYYIDSTNVLCYGDSTGAITAIPTGGEKPYTYVIDAAVGQTDGNGRFTGLPADTYIVTAIDARGCNITREFNITQPPKIEIIHDSIVAPTCNGYSNGNITVWATGGEGTLTAAINPDPHNVSTVSFTSGMVRFVNLSDGIYTITITDTNGCDTTATYSVEEPDQLVIDVSYIQEISCNGAADGVITYSVSGGTPPYKFNMNDGTENTTGVFSGLEPGRYFALVTDINNCPPTVLSDTVVLVEPALISITSEQSKNISCFGEEDGTITVTATGGTAPLTYTLMPDSIPSTTGAFTNLAAGSYHVVVSDVNGCPPATSKTFTIIEPAVIDIINELSTDITCYGYNDGTITVTATGGTAPLTYTLMPGSIPSATGAFTDLAAGSYYVIVTDSTDCPSATSVTFNIEEPTEIVITKEEFENITCNNYNDGKITVLAEGGRGVLTYTLMPGYIPSATGAFTDLAAGSYYVIVTDTSNCTKVSSEFNIINPAQIVFIKEESTNITCFGMFNGTITVPAEGGVGDTLTYNLNTGEYNYDGIFTGLPSGNYTVTVTDSVGCYITSRVFNITAPTSVISIDSLSVNDPNCHGAYGSIFIRATGGTPYPSRPFYRYFISSAPTDENSSGLFPNLSAGMYSVTATDANGCNLIVDSLIITEPDTITITGVEITDVSCFGGSDGEIIVTAAGGTLPLEYMLNGGERNNDGVFSGLIKGCYTVTVSDANNCPPYAIEDAICITEPEKITIKTEIYTNITCNNYNDGTITITATGGNAPLIYAITPGSDSNNTGKFEGLSEGDYTVTVTDSLGCESAISSLIHIDNPDVIIASIDDYSDITCNNTNDGTVTATASGGTAPLYYTLKPIDRIQIDNGFFENLEAGSYWVEVTDSLGCTESVTDTITIINPPIIAIDSVSQTEITCFGETNASITVYASGGTAPLTYTLMPGGTVNSSGEFTNLGAGDYFVIVTDDNSCPSDTSQIFTIIEPDNIVIEDQGYTDITCFGENNGTFAVSAIGGTGTLNYTIQPLDYSNTTGLFDSLSAGTYWILITDNNNCPVVSSDTITIIEPATIDITVQTPTDISCFDAHDGAITIVAVGGTGTLKYTLHPLGEQNTTGLFDSLAAGDYWVEVTDTLDCPAAASDTITIVEPEEIIFTTKVFGYKCYEDVNTGSIEVTVVSGGVGGLTFDIGNGTPQLNNGLFENLALGKYAVTITDETGCWVKTDSLEITTPLPLEISLIDSLLSCGSLPVIEAGVTFLPDGSGVEYASTIHHVDFADGATVQSIDDINSISVNMEHSYLGDLTLKLTCPSGESLTIVGEKGGGRFLGEPVKGGYGFVDTIPGNGYTYLFAKDAAQTFLNAISQDERYTYTDNAGFLHEDQLYVPAGTYMPEQGFEQLVGCQLNGDWTLTVVDRYVQDNGYIFKWGINFAPSTVPEGYDNGGATVAVTGGAEPYTYLWSNGDTTNMLSDVGADTYYLTVTDANNCSITDTVVIENVNIHINILDTTHVLCAGTPEGSAIIEAYGGNAPYAYVWSNGATGPEITDLDAGWYFVTITDRNLCEAVDSIEIKSQYAVDITFTDIIEPLCNAGNEGSTTASATAIVQGGSGNYTYLWSSGETDSIAVSLAAGWNYITVTDNVTACETQDSLEIAEPLLLEITQIAIDSITCYGGTDGEIIITVEGGTPPYNIEWYDMNENLVATGDTLTAVPAGDYKVTISDSSLCTVRDSIISIPQTDSIMFDLDLVASDCLNPTGSATVSNITGGNGFEIITWYDAYGQPVSTGLTIENLVPGSYMVEVKDLYNCYSIQNFKIKPDTDMEFAGFNVIQPISCYSSCDGIVEISVSGTGPFFYQWNNGSDSSSIGNICIGDIISVTVTNSAGCTIDTTYYLDGPDSLMIEDIITVDNNCETSTMGSVQAVVSGGTLPYTYTWTDSLGSVISMGETVSDLASGKYYLTVVDAHGCTVTDSTEVGFSLIGITVTSTTTPATCGASDGTAILTVTGGIEPITYHWPAPIGTISEATVNILAVGIYNVTVEDAVGCAVVHKITIEDTGEVEIIDTIIANATCYEGCDGYATIIADGGEGPYTYEWKDLEGNIVSNTQTAENLCGGQTYSAKVIDNSGCAVVIDVYIDHPAQIQVTVTKQDVSCFEATDGTALISATGGISPNGLYSYLWEDGSTEAYQDSLAAGDYNVIVTDEAGCTTVFTFQVGSPTPIEYTLDIIKPTCLSNNGVITLTSITGGSGSGYTVAWSHHDWTADSTGMSITNLVSGVYMLQITDDKNCTITDEIIIANDTDLLASIDSTTLIPSCYGGATGSVTILITGGTPEYSVLWDNGQIGATLDSVTAGTYMATIEDAAGCQTTLAVIIPENPEIITNIIIDRPIACGTADATADIHVSVIGGTLPFIYNWTMETIEGDVQVSTDSTLIGAVPGKYWVEVADSIGCTVVDSIEIIQATDPILITYETTSTDCGVETGTIRATVTGGVQPYTYNWMMVIDSTAVISGQGTDFVYNLGAGAYVLEITDYMGCTVVGDTISVESNTDMYLTISDLQSVYCPTGNDGSATLTITEGTAPFIVTWRHEIYGSFSETTEDRIVTNNQLYAGYQEVHVEDISGCKTFASFRISTDSVLNVITTTYPDILNDNMPSGIIRAVVTGGIPEYEYYMENATGESISGSIIQQSPYYTLSFNNLTAGMYYLTITDSNDPSCAVVDSIEVFEDSIEYEICGIQDVTCYGGNDGSICINGTGGSGAYSYAWSNGATGGTITNLTAGVYTFTMTDGAYPLVEIIDSVEVKQPAPMNLTLRVESLAGCNSQTGSIIATLGTGTGAILPVKYEWASPLWNSYPNADSVTVDAGISDIIENIGVGMYYLTVTDANGCTAIDSVEMIDNNDLSLQLIPLNPLCYGGNTGEITAMIDGAEGNILYEWSHDSSLQANIARGLTAGIYSLTVTDEATGCSRWAEIELTQPDSLEFVEIVDIMQPACYSDMTGGGFTAVVAGGTAPYNMIITDVATGIRIVNVEVDNSAEDTLIVTGLQAGQYTVRIIDAGNCYSVERTLDIESTIPQLQVEITTDQLPSCNMGALDGILTANVTAMMFNEPIEPQPNESHYDYIWSTGDSAKTIEGIGLGEYSVTVTYDGLCATTATVSIDTAVINIISNATFNREGQIIQDTIVCVGDAVSFFSIYDIYNQHGEYMTADSIKWISKNSIYVKPVTDTIEYYVVAADSTANNKIYLNVYYNGCVGIDSLTLRTFDIPSVQIEAYVIDKDMLFPYAGEELISMFAGGKAIVKVDVKVTDSTSYTWSERLHTTVAGLEQRNSILQYNADNTIIEVQPMDSTIYYVQAKTKVYPESEHYCYSNDSTIVRVLGEFTPPNAFTPNGDGINDTWELEGFYHFSSVKVQIVNRWGSLIFETDDPYVQWDGTNKKGKNVSMGTYYYIIEYTSDTGSRKISGPVTVIR